MTRVHAYRRRVSWADCDATGMWRFTAALLFVEEAEVSLLRAAGVLAALYGRLPRAYVEARFLRAAAFDDQVTVGLSLARIGNTSLHYEFEIRLRTALAAAGKLGVVMVGDSGAPQPVPCEVRALLDRWMTSAPAAAEAAAQHIPFPGDA